jgi:hypothetical protein
VVLCADACRTAAAAPYSLQRDRNRGMKCHAY